ncbi:hypothetical protein IQ06DRAFT_310189 [Phaeosphaeriaceae sp. SRC1lsM3a]|nr:hypothetical protein IQ06DRAFT_310189 [Stagonospora sp. SRC1lsM3a]
MCMLQALLHNKNLTTLVMLSPIIFLPYEFLSLALDLIHCSQGVSIRVGLQIVRISVLTLACVVILLVEYRLKITFLKSSLWTMLSAGTARALRRVASEHDSENLPTRREETFCFLGAGSIIAPVWILATQHDPRAFADFKYAPLTVMIVNAVSTTVALLLGRSIIFSLNEDRLDEVVEDSYAALRRWHDGVVLMIVSGVANCSLVLSIRRSYTSWPQFCCFAIALLCATLGPWRASRDCQPDGEVTAYELVESMSPTSLEDEEAEHVLRSKVRAQQQCLTTSKSWRHAWSTLGVVAVALLWAGSVAFNITAPDPKRLPASIDRSYEPSLPLEIVLSMYKEPISDVQNLLASLKSAHETRKASVTIYTKDESADTEDIKLSTGADSVIQLPNIGREGETYLHHITTRWDTLAKHTMYLQADVHFSKTFYTRLRNYFVPDRTGFLNLAFFEPCHCAQCGDEFWWWDHAKMIPKYFTKIYNSTCGDRDVLLSYTGSFIASAARTRGLGKEFFQDLRQALVDRDSWAHGPEYLQGRADSMAAPDFGYTLERMWGLIFQCAEMDVAWKCPSSMSGWRFGGDVLDCQCFDSE